MRLALPSPIILVRRQVVCLVLATIVGTFFWANGQKINPVTILLYSILIGNMTIPLTERLNSAFRRFSFPYHWPVFVLIMVLLAVPVYVISSVVVWRLAPPSPQSLLHLILTGWKLPVVVTIMFSVFTHLYRRTREQLERRNQDLARSVQERSAELEQQEKEMERAREIQLSLLPRKIPQVVGFEVAVAWRPARAVSGDYYDVFKLDDHRLALCIADVVGKGASAALLMANVQAAVRALAGSAETPARLCTRVNRLLCENLATGKFVTFLYGVLDCERRKLAYCNAGHMHPILLSESGSRTLAEGGAALGVFPEWQYEDASVDLRSGDRLLLYTDGITEAANAREQEFGESNLASAARAHCADSAAEMSKVLLDQVSGFCGAHFQDDATLLVIAVS